MTKYFTGIVAMLATCLFAGCSSDDEVFDSTDCSDLFDEVTMGISIVYSLDNEKEVLYSHNGAPAVKLDNNDYEHTTRAGIYDALTFFNADCYTYESFAHNLAGYDRLNTVCKRVSDKPIHTSAYIKTTFSRLENNRIQIGKNIFDYIGKKGNRFFISGNPTEEYYSGDNHILNEYSVKLSYSRTHSQINPDNDKLFFDSFSDFECFLLEQFRQVMGDTVKCADRAGYHDYYLVDDMIEAVRQGIYPFYGAIPPIKTIEVSEGTLDPYFEILYPHFDIQK